MTKRKTAYCCQACGAIHFKWSGKCPDCQAWNSMVEEFAEGGTNVTHFSHIEAPTIHNTKNKKALAGDMAGKVEFVDLAAAAQEFPRINVGIKELDRTLGDGLVQGSAVLIGGDPGIGKSTLLLQTAEALAKKKVPIFYISGEESVDQVRLRAKRLGITDKAIKFAATTNVAEIISSVKASLAGAPNAVMIIDSIQTMFIDDLSSAPGTVSQVRAAAFELTVFAKQHNVTLIVVSHVTKDGQIAGPKVLEHMVDTVLYFEGDKDSHFRILRAVKNRFGAANEIGVFEMNEVGLSEVSNPSELFLTTYERTTSGTAVFAGIEGTRPLLVEIQALISPSFIPTPRRAVVGWDLNRLAMIVAILNNRFGLNLFDKEIYLNIVGGLKVEETAADLAVACALISAARDVALPSLTIAIGEVGLTGEVRMVSNLEVRLKEAAKLGFKKCLVPQANKKSKNWESLKKSLTEIELIPIGHVRELGKIIGR